jgi:hypothetical protein
VLTNFVVASVVDLLTPARFPNDTKITAKAAQIEQAWTRYVNIAPFCYGNCSGMTHGQCTKTGYFNFGLCSCFAEWSANPIDCSQPTPTTTPVAPVAKILKRMKNNERGHAIRATEFESFLN